MPQNVPPLRALKVRNLAARAGETGSGAGLLTVLEMVRNDPYIGGKTGKCEKIVGKIRQFS